jgi:hypothetical protein
MLSSDFRKNPSSLLGCAGGQFNAREPNACGINGLWSIFSQAATRALTSDKTSSAATCARSSQLNLRFNLVVPLMA